jgi:hypothetical protein
VSFYVLPSIPLKDGVHILRLSLNDRGSSGHYIGISIFLGRTGQVTEPEVVTTQPNKIVD